MDELSRDQIVKQRENKKLWPSKCHLAEESLHHSPLIPSSAKLASHPLHPYTRPDCLPFVLQSDCSPPI